MFYEFELSLITYHQYNILYLFCAIKQKFLFSNRGCDVKPTVRDVFDLCVGKVFVLKSLKKITLNN